MLFNGQKNCNFVSQLSLSKVPIRNYVPEKSAIKFVQNEAKERNIRKCCKETAVQI